MARLVLGKDIYSHRASVAPTEEEIERWRRIVYENARALQEELGKPVTVDERVLRLVIARWRRDGLPYCPCRPRSRSSEHICPCTDLEEIAQRKRTRCTCRLYRVE